MSDELQELRKHIEELTELYQLQSKRAMDYACAFMRSKREWVELTDEEIKNLHHIIDWTNAHTYVNFARAIEAKLKEKNT